MKKINSSPDVIFIITDQERATQHFPKGWEQENLPTLTKLKENGFSFDIKTPTRNGGGFF